MMLITHSHPGVFTVLGLISLGVAACGTNPQEPEADLSTATPTAAEQPAPVPDMIEMGGAKSVTTFFITSVGPGNGGDLGGLDGADAHCQALAEAEYAGDHTWRAYLSTTATDTTPAVHARDRIGAGPWYNAEGMLIAYIPGEKILVQADLYFPAAPAPNASVRSLQRNLQRLGLDVETIVGIHQAPAPMSQFTEFVGDGQ